MLLQELCISQRLPPTLWCDNIGATYLAANLVFHVQTKNVKINVHIVMEKVARKDLIIQFICTSNQLADILTSSLSTARFEFPRDYLNLCLQLVQLKGMF